MNCEKCNLKIMKDGNCHICINCERVYRSCPICNRLLKFLGFDGFILHNEFKRIIRPNREQNNFLEDTMLEDINNKFNLKMFKPFKKKLPFEQEISNVFIPFYVGDKNIYYMDKHCGLDHISKIKIEIDFTNKMCCYYWKCENCDKDYEFKS